MQKPSLENLTGYSEIATLMRSQFVSAKETADGLPTPLGAIETWSSSLRNAFAILLNSGCPMFLVWDCDSTQNRSGERILFYNDVYLSLLKKTQLLTPVDQIPLDQIEDSWTGDWRTIQADVEQVFTTGQGLRREMNLFLAEHKGNGNGHLYVWSYSAVRDETDQIRGVFATGCQVLTEEIVATATVGKGFQEEQALLPSHAVLEPQEVQSSLQQAEAALRESEARFQAFMSHSPVSAWIVDQDGRLLYLSPTYAQMFQLPQPDAVGKQIHDIYSEEFAQQFLENNRRVFQTGQVIEIVETAPRPDGSIGSFLGYKFPIAQASGEMLVGGVAVDITERQQTEELLRQREETLRLITNALPVLIAYVDKDHYYRFNNQTYETWFGRPAVSFTGQPVRAVLGDAAYEAIRPSLEQVLSGQQVSFESQIPYREGGTRYIRADYIPHINTQGEVEGFFSLVSDISDRKQIERALIAQEQRYRHIFEMVSVSIWEEDFSEVKAAIDQLKTVGVRDFRQYFNDHPEFVQQAVGMVHLRDVNQASLQVFGAQTKAELLNSLHLIFTPETQEAFVGELLTIAAGETRFATKTVLQTLQGDRLHVWFSITFPPPSESYDRVLVSLLDITDREQAEEALQQSEERYRYLAELIPQLVWTTNAEGVLIDINQRWSTFTGITLAQVQTEGWQAIVHPDDVPTLSQNWVIAQQNKIYYQAEGRMRRADGVYRWHLHQAIPLLNEAGQLIKWFGTATDIEDQKQLEQQRTQLLQQEQTAREQAENAERRSSFLAEASTTLTSSLDYEYTLSSVAQAVVPTLADWCAVDILKDDGTLERLATTHIDPAKVQWGTELHRRYPPNLDAPQGIGQVLRTGQSEYYPTISDDQLVVAARDAEHLEILREIGFSSAMLVPLNARGKTLGIISFVSTESGRAYSPDDLSLAEELARRAAIALDNARLYRDAQHARQVAERAVDRTTRLQTVTAALSESLTPEQVAEVIVAQSMATLEALAALVVLVSPDRTELEIVKSVGYQTDLVESWRRFSINTDVPLATAIRTGEPVWIETTSEQLARYPHLAEIYRRYEFNAWIALPLVVEGKSIGGMLLSFKEFRLLSQDDRDFVLALTRQCAQAIVRAQLYAAEQQARAEAEKANRIKDEFLAVLSHELRSPLNPILGWAKLLQTREFDEQTRKGALETIERNARLQAQLVEDLLDVSRILGGKLLLNRASINLVTIVQAAIETVRLAAEAKEIAIQTVFASPVGQVMGDAARLQQILWNLLTNAVKFTPNGGQVVIRLEQVDMAVQIQVSDTGKGIAPEFLPHVFEYFRQEDSKTTRQFGGLGLGLAIVRYLTELHGGTVAAESAGEGQGVTFTVKLPLLKTEARETLTAPTLASSPSLAPLLNVQVLVVDDDADARELTAFVLEQAGAIVTVVPSALAALDVLTQFQPDVLVSDIGMPEMDGYALIRQIRQLPEPANLIPAVALTAYAGEVDQQQAIDAGFQIHLSKPVEPEAITSVIARLSKRSG